MKNSDSKVIKIGEVRNLNIKHPLVFTAGAFDLLHPGHVHFLQKCKEFGNTLIVGVSSDKRLKIRKGESRPIIDETDRAFMVSCLECVDYAVIINTPAETNETIDKIMPDYLVMSSENREVKEEKLKPVLEKHPELKVEFIEGKFYKKFSTSAIIEKILKSCKE